MLLEYSMASALRSLASHHTQPALIPSPLPSLVPTPALGINSLAKKVAKGILVVSGFWNDGRVFFPTLFFCA